MKKMYNRWRHRPETWMQQDTLAEYQGLSGQVAHKKLQSSFSTHLFQLAGSKFFLHELIRLPWWCCAERPDHQETGHVFPPVTLASVLALVTKWRAHRNSPVHRGAVIASQQRKEGQHRLSQQLWQAQRDMQIGQRLCQRMSKEKLTFQDMTEREMELEEAFRLGHLQQALKELMAQKKPRYPGAATAA